jgi:hypothetical protein
VRRSDEAVARAVARATQYRSLHVGWAALTLTGGGVLLAVLLSVTGRLDPGTSGFIAGVVLTGTVLGLATWDLFVGLLAFRNAPHLAIPDQITLGIPRRLVPFLSPIAFFGGILVGHQFWQ